MSRRAIGLAALGLGAVLLAAALLADVVLDQGRFVDRLTGHATLVSACLPELIKGLDRSGYAPSDLEFEDRHGFEGLFGSSLEGHFTFADGPGETRIDGIMACVVVGKAAHVDFRASALPHRAA